MGESPWRISAAVAQEPPFQAGVLVVTVLVLLVTFRAFSEKPASSRNGQRIPGTPGYWLPYLGHVPQILVNTGGLLADGRRKFTDGAFSLLLLGKTHYVLYKPSLVDPFLKSRKAGRGDSWLTQRVLRSVFGLSRKDMLIYNDLRSELEALGHTHLRDASVEPTVKQLRNHVADLVSFNSYPADQMDWERMADADAIKGDGDESAMQVDLVELVKHFAARMSSVGLFGTDFAENFPEFWQMLWILDKGFIPLALNVPSWLPWPSAQRARTARRKLLSEAYEFHAALDKHLEGIDTDPRWQDLDNVGPLVLARAKLFRDKGMSLDGRAMCDVALAWDMNAATCMLVSWILTELYRDPVFLAQIREEIQPFVKAVQPKNDFGVAVWVPPEIRTVDIDGLASRCPLLKASYLETLRVYSTGLESSWLPEDITLKGSELSAEPVSLKGGSYVHVPAEVHNLDPRAFQDSHEWRATRHLQDSADNTSKQVVEESRVRTQGHYVTANKPESLQLKEVLVYTAILISVYDVEPPKGQHWKAIKTSRSANGRRPSRPIKVWVKRRELATS